MEKWRQTEAAARDKELEAAQKEAAAKAQVGCFPKRDIASTFTMRNSFERRNVRMFTRVPYTEERTHPYACATFCARTYSFAY